MSKGFKRELTLTKTKKATGKPPLVGLVVRMKTPTALKLAVKVAAWLKQNGFQPGTAPEQKKLPGTVLLTSAQYKRSSLVVAIGGDGTYLRAVRLLDGSSVPVLGINQGSLGFLTLTRAEEVLEALQKALAGDVQILPRSILAVELIRRGRRSAPVLALNDVVVERGSLSQMIHLQVSTQGRVISQMRGDGVILASPTGSTAYNLAVGGPLVDPLCKVLLVTPIAAHSLSSRPLVLPDSHHLQVDLVGKLHSAHLVVDGQTIAKIRNGDQVIVRKTNHDHLMVADLEFSYFDLLKEKLRFGDRSI